MSFRTSLTFSYAEHKRRYLEKFCFSPYNESPWGPKQHWTPLLLLFIVWSAMDTTLSKVFPFVFWNLFLHLSCNAVSSSFII